MATSYTGLRVQDTYNAIIKIGDNSNLTATPKLLSDGLGNDSPLYLSGTRLGIGISPTYQFHTSGNAKIGGNLIVSGNLTVNGTLTYLNVQDLAVEDPIIKLAKDNTANTLDIGLFGKYVATGTKYKGFFNDASDDKFKLFIGTTVEPTTTVDTSASGYTVGTLVANIEGNVTGNLTGGTVSGTQATFSSSTAPVIKSTSSSTAENILLEGTDTSAASAPDLVLYRNAGATSDNDTLGVVEFRGRNDANTGVKSYSGIYSRIIDASENEGALTFSVNSGSNYVNAMAIHNTGTNQPKVIIGNTDAFAVPTHTLDVDGTLHVSGDATFAKIIAGSHGGTSGSILLQQKYTGNDIISTIGTMYSSGGLLLGYAVAPKNGASGFISTADNGNFARAYMLLDNNEFTIGYAAAQTTAVGSDITGLTTPFTLDITNGNATFAGNVDIDGNLQVDGTIKDSSGDAGTSGQLLSSTGTGTNWIDFEADVAKRIEITVKNVSGSTLVKGAAVHASPTATPPSGNVIEVIGADNDVTASMPSIGILNEEIADEAEGQCVMVGSVIGINTSSFTAGEELYVGSTPGVLTNTKPTSTSNQIQKIAVVIKSHASNGQIEVFGAGRANDVPNLVDRTITFDPSINVTASQGFGRIEIGGPSGGYIDLKAPASDDYDMRFITSQGGNEITTASGNLKINTANTLALTIDSSQNATFVGQVITSSSSSGDYVRMYGGSGTAQWDIYGNGENLRISENSGGGGHVDIDTSLNVDSGLSAATIGISGTNGTDGKGISLYGGANSGEPTYGMMFQQTSSFGTFGYVSGDWATYFTMNSSSNRGWIFRNVSTSTNVASINNQGQAHFQTPSKITSNDTSLTFEDAGTNAMLIKVGAGDELYIGSNNTYQFRGTTVGQAQISSNGYLNLTSGASNYAGIQMYQTDGSIVGYFYGDGGSGSTPSIGILDSDGNWALRAVRDSYVEFRVNNVIKLQTTTSINYNYQPTWIEGGSADWDQTTPGTSTGSLHLVPSSTDNFGSAITFGASDRFSGTNAQAGIYTRSDGTYGTKMYFATTGSYASGSKNGMMIDYNGNVGVNTSNPLSKFVVSEGTDQHGIELAPGTLSYLQCYDRATSTYGNMTIDAKYLAFGLDNGAEKIRFTADGYVGIGLSDPTRQLHLKRTSGDVRGIMVETTVATSYAEVQVKAASEFRIGTGGSSTTPNGQFYIYDATSGAHRFDIDASGHVGIGTVSPYDSAWGSNSKQLTISGGTYGVLNLIDTGGPTRFAIGAGDSKLYLAYDDVAGAHRIVVSSSGNVGIGPQSTGTLNNKLQVSTGVDGDGIILTGIGDNTGIANGSYRKIGFRYDDTDESFESEIRFVVTNASAHGGQMEFFTDDTGGVKTRAITITNAQRVGIGEVSPAQKLQVAGNIRVGDVAGSGRPYIDYVRNGGAVVGGIGWHTDDVFYVGAHPAAGPTAGNELRVYGFDDELRLGCTSYGDMMFLTESGGTAKVGIGASPSSAAGVANYLSVRGSSHAGIVLQDTDGGAIHEMWNDGGTLNMWDSSVGYRIRFYTSGDAQAYNGWGAASLGITGSNGNDGKGLSLYGGAAGGEPTYGMMFMQTATFGTYGSVSGDYATYFTMNNNASRGWIFRRVGNANYASISGGGDLSLSGQVLFPTTNQRIAGLNGTYLQIKSGSASDGGINLVNTSGTNLVYLYGNGSDCGIINSGGYWAFRHTQGGHTYLYAGNQSYNWRFQSSNGYAYFPSWINLSSGTGLFTGSNGGHFYGNEGSTYGAWRTSGSRNGYSGTYDNHSTNTANMFDSSGNGGNFHASAGWHFYYNRSNTCLGVGNSTTASSYSLYVTGKIYSTDDIIAYSDKRVKENIVTVDSAIEKVNKLRGVYYTPKIGEDKSRKVGVIAQEILQVLPEVVTYDEGVDQYGVDYGKITGLLIEAIKDQQKQIDKLTKFVDKLNK